MKNVLILASILAVGALIWLMQRTADSGGTRATVDAGGLGRAAVAPLPAFDAGLPVKDVNVPDAAINGAYVRANGAFGMPAPLVDDALAINAAGEFWKRTPGPNPSYRSGRNVTVTLQVEDGKVAGARMEFPKTGMSADLMAASPLLTGDHCGLEPSGMVMSDPTRKGTKLTGDFVCNKRTIFYRGEVDRTGGPPRPLWFEYRLEAFE